MDLTPTQFEEIVEISSSPEHYSTKVLQNALEILMNLNENGFLWCFNNIPNLNSDKAKIHAMIIVMHWCQVNIPIPYGIFPSLRDFFFKNIFSDDSRYLKVLGTSQYFFMAHSYPYYWESFWSDLFSFSEKIIITFFDAFISYSGNKKEIEAEAFFHIKETLIKNPDSLNLILVHLFQWMNESNPYPMKIIASFFSWIDPSYFMIPQVILHLKSFLSSQNTISYIFHIMIVIFRRKIPISIKLQMIQSLEIPSLFSSLMSSNPPIELIEMLSEFVNEAFLSSSQISEHDYAIMGLELFNFDNESVEVSILPLLKYQASKNSEIQIPLLTIALKKLYKSIVQNDESFKEQVLSLIQKCYFHDSTKVLTFFKQIFQSEEVKDQIEILSLFEILRRLCIVTPKSLRNEFLPFLSNILPFFSLSEKTDTRVNIISLILDLTCLLSEIIIDMVNKTDCEDKKGINLPTALFMQIISILSDEDFQHHPNFSHFFEEVAKFIFHFYCKIQFTNKEFNFLLSFPYPILFRSFGYINTGNQEYVLSFIRFLTLDSKIDQERILLLLSFCQSLKYSDIQAFTDALFPIYQSILTTIFELSYGEHEMDQDYLLSLFVRMIHQNLSYSCYPFIIKSLEQISNLENSISPICSLSSICNVFLSFYASRSFDSNIEQFSNLKDPNLIFLFLGTKIKAVFCNFGGWIDNELSNQIIVMITKFFSLIIFFLKANKFIPERSFFVPIQQIIDSSFSTHRDNPNLIKTCLSFMTSFIPILPQYAIEQFCPYSFGIFSEFTFSPNNSQWSLAAKAILKLHSRIIKFLKEDGMHFIVNNFKEVVDQKENVIHAYLSLLSLPSLKQSFIAFCEFFKALRSV